MLRTIDIGLGSGYASWERFLEIARIIRMDIPLDV
jgi:hypothetical protein